MSKPFTTAEAVSHFAIHSDLAGVKALAGFCAPIVESTAHRWLKEVDKPPTGVNLIKLRVFLGLVGLSPSEFEVLDADRQSIAKAVALNLYSVDAVKDMLGYHHTNAVFDIFLRNSGFDKGKQFRLKKLSREAGPTTDEILEHHREELSWLREMMLAPLTEADEPSPDATGDDGAASPEPEDDAAAMPAPPAGADPTPPEPTPLSAQPAATEPDGDALVIGRSEIRESVEVTGHDAVRIALSLLGSLEVALDVINKDPRREELLQAIGLAASHRQVKGIITTLLFTHQS